MLIHSSALGLPTSKRKKYLNLGMMKHVWFEKLFGFKEKPFLTTRASFSIDEDNWLVCPSAPLATRSLYIGEFGTPSVAELKQLCLALKSTASGLGGLRFEHQTDPSGVNAMILDPANANCVFQAASQFNCLEMPSPGVTPRQGITDYVNDPTQGPKCALACPAALVYRNYLCRGGIGQGDTQIDCLQDVGALLGNKDGALWHMQNGYALPRDRSSMQAIGSRLEADAELVRGVHNALRVGVHWSTSVYPPAAHRVTQVFASALPVAYSSLCPPEDWQPFASAVLAAAYDATLLVAEKIAKSEERRVVVFLTKLGGGVFGNSADWISIAIEEALARHADAPLDVRLIHYGKQVDSAYLRITPPSLSC